MTKNVLIIGGAATGMKAAARLRRRDPEAEITVLEQGEYLSYGSCGLPYFVDDVVHEEQELYSTPIGVARDTSFFRNVISRFIRPFKLYGARACKDELLSHSLKVKGNAIKC